MSTLPAKHKTTSSPVLETIKLVDYSDSDCSDTISIVSDQEDIENLQLASDVKHFLPTLSHSILDKSIDVNRYADSEHFEELSSDAAFLLEPLIEIAEDSCCAEKDCKHNLATATQKVKLKSHKCIVTKKPMQHNPCVGKKCGNNCATNFTDEDRHNIHEHFWGMASAQRQKEWLLTSIKRQDIIRKRSLSNLRKVSYYYYINFQEKQTKVCQQFLLKTLGISQMILRSIIAHSSTAAKNRNRKPPHNKSDESKLVLLKDFIDQLPTATTQCWRKTSNSLFLPQEFRNIPTLYRHYVEHFQMSNQESSILSLSVFRRTFNNEYNIGFYPIAKK